jgi:transposase
MLPNNCQILLYNKTVDMRKSIDGLSIIISEHLHLNPSDGSIHIFYNKQYDKLKMLYWHKNGFNLLYKRLEKERFKIPKLVAARCITYEQLRWLFDGLDIDKITGFQPLKYSKYLIKQQFFCKFTFHLFYITRSYLNKQHQ